MSNTRIWDKLGKTDPGQTKSFKRSGGFYGTAIKPMWSFKRMTEEFGSCGIGWGVNEPSFQVVTGCDGEVLVYCTVSIWYVEDTPASITLNHKRKSESVFGVGGDKVVVKQSSGLRSDDEAFKKAYTDAIGNALKLIGVGADVHMGLFDDSKYVNEMRQEFSEPQQERKPAQAQQPSIYTRLSTANAACTTKAEFNKLWGAAATINAQKTLVEPEASLIETAKAKKFAELEKKEPSNYSPPNFDSLPDPTKDAINNLSAG